VAELRIISREVISRSHGDFEQQIRLKIRPSSLFYYYYNCYIVCYNKCFLVDCNVEENKDATGAVISKD
jgi:hypothetical protein